MATRKNASKTKRSPISKASRETNLPMEQSLQKLSKQIKALEKAVNDLKQKQAAQKLAAKLAAKKEKTRSQVKRRTQRKKVKKLKESLI